MTHHHHDSYDTFIMTMALSESGSNNNSDWANLSWSEICLQCSMRLIAMAVTIGLFICSFIISIDG